MATHGHASYQDWIGRLIVLPDRNFSGRSGFLRWFVMAAMRGDVERSVWPAGYRATLLPLHCDLMHSNIAPTAAEELALHGFAAQDCPPRIGALLDRIADANPSNLSGGEHVLLALACAMALGTEALFIDGALEQLDDSMRAEAIAWIGRPSRRLWTIICDGREHWVDRLSEAEWRAAVGGIGTRSEPAMQIEIRPMSATERPKHETRRQSTIAARGLSFRYPGGANILEKADFEFSPNTLIHLAGANGSGKTTLAKLLCGAVRPSAGSLEFVDGAGPAAPRERIAISFQNPDHSLVADTPSGELHQRAGGAGSNEAWLRAFGLESASRLALPGLPLAMRKRVSLAAAFAQPASWLFLDEPTLGLDRASKDVLAAIVAGETQAGRGCIIVSHDARWIGELPHRTVVIADGAICEA